MINLINQQWHFTNIAWILKYIEKLHEVFISKWINLYIFVICIKYSASVFQYVYIFRMNKVLFYALLQPLL